MEERSHAQSITYSQLRILTFLQLHGIPADPPKNKIDKGVGFRQYMIDGIRNIQESFIYLMTGKAPEVTKVTKSRREIDAENLKNLERLTQTKDGDIKTFKDFDSLSRELSKYHKR